MNNYSMLQQFLHRFVLSSQFVREVMFDIEQSVFLKKNNNFNDNHVFVAGLARSGTTVLLNALYQSNQFASLTYDDMPFVLAPNLWEKINRRSVHGEAKERTHGDSIKVATNSPEAFEEVFWKTFGDDSKNSREFFINYISIILKKNNKTRYLSKNNQNIRRLTVISDCFPQSKILIPFRDPLQHVSSLFSQHKRFVKEQTKDKFIRNYMDWIGHSEFGLGYKMIHPSNLQYPDEMQFNHWLEQWYLTYKLVLELSAQNKECYLIGYESLCINPNVWDEIKELVSIEKEIKFLFKESKNVIDQDFDKKLSDACYILFESLIKESIVVN